MLGRTFYLMGFVDGWSPMDVDELARAVRHRPRRAPGPGVPAGRGHRAARRKVDWQAKGLQDLGRPDGFHERQVDRWTAFLERIKGRELPGFDEAAAWLRAHRPIDFVPGLMHGDYQFANVMYQHGGPARLAAIVDWEMGTVGDPKLDLGWVVQSWPEDTSAGEASDGGLRRHVRHAGARPRCSRTTPRCRVARSTTSTTTSCSPSGSSPSCSSRASSARGDDAKLQAFGPIVLELMQGAADLAETTDYRHERRRPSWSGSAAGASSSSGSTGPRRATRSRRLLGELGGAGRRRGRARIRALVLTGTGDRAFCAGMDLRAFADGDVASAATPDADGRLLPTAQRRGPVPVVGAANGTAVAGGFELLLGCDVIVASSDAKFGLPEVKRGLFPARRRHDARPAHAARRRAGAGADRRQHRRRTRAYDLGLVNAVVSARRGARRRAGVRRADRRQRRRSGSPRRKELVRLGVVDPTRAAERLREWQPVVFASEDARKARPRSSRSGTPVWRGR